MCSSEPLVPRALSSAQQLCCIGALNTLVFLPEFRLLRAASRFDSCSDLEPGVMLTHTGNPPNMLQV